MTRIVGIGGGVPAARRAGRAAGGFTLPGATEPAAAEASRPAAAAGALLALQEAPRHLGTPAERARRRATQTLDELRGLQLDLLRGWSDPARLERLAALASAAEGIGDAALQAAIGEVALRARVELARRRVASASAG